MSFCYERDFAVIDTTDGRIRGFETFGVLCFRGVPYAKARRFHAPERLTRRDEIFDATSYGSVCPLLKQDDPKGEIYVPHRFWPMSENCLNLNIWTPAADDAKRPVLVWLHGGGYEAGSAIEHIAYDGLAMAKHGDAVVVTVNHRLNILGYLDLSDFGDEYENSGNCGGDDIIKALEWVRDNIASFGGDPDNVTVFGQSGGGAKVTTLLQSPDADGLYHKGFNMSGVIGPILADARGSGRECVEMLMKALSIKRVKSLEKVPYAKLAAAYNKIRPILRAEGKNAGCMPHPNAHYLGEPVLNGFREETKHIPLLVGTVFGEFTSFGPAPFDRHAVPEADQLAFIRRYLDADSAEKLTALFRQAYPERPVFDLLKLDYVFRAPTIEYLKKRAEVNDHTYAYLFNMDQPLFGGSTPWHCSDIPYVFRNIHLVEYPNGSADASAVQNAIFESVMAFARTGDPNNAAMPEWKPCAPDAEHTMVIDADPRVRTNFDHELVPAAARAIAPVSQRIMAELSGQTQH